MRYITYFDLLGTRGFCDNSELYYKNISKFNKAVTQTAALLVNYGKVGIFSDSAYAESDKLKPLLQFLVLLRNRLMADGLFFNAVIKKGDLGIVSTTDIASNVFGVAFQNKEIAGLYNLQVSFKGIGIFVDKSITDAEVNEAGFSISQCIYMGKKRENNFEKYVPLDYRDIAFQFSAINNEKYWSSVVEILLRAFYEAYVNAPKHGAYYISVFSNFIRSFGTDLAWDMQNKKFIRAFIMFDVLDKMVTSEYRNLQDLPGLDCLVLVLLDMAYSSNTLNEHDRDSITNKYFSVDCIKRKYLHDLNSLPENILHSGPNGDYRARFIRYCQEDAANNFVNSVLSSQ